MTDSTIYERITDLAAFAELCGVDEREIRDFHAMDLEEYVAMTLDELLQYTTNGVPEHLEHWPNETWQWMMASAFADHYRSAAAGLDAIEAAVRVGWEVHRKQPLLMYLREADLSPMAFLVDVWFGIQVERGALKIARATVA